MQIARMAQDLRGFLANEVAKIGVQLRNLHQTKPPIENLTAALL